MNKDKKRPGIPPEFYGASASNIQLEDSECKRLGKFITQSEFPNAIFYGPPGRCKTYAAIACMYFLESKGINWYDMKYSFLPLLNQKWLSNVSSYQDNYEILLDFSEKDLLILDDLGVRRPSDGFLDFLYCLINNRNNNPHLKTIYTTNMSSKELNDIYGSRIVSRIFQGEQFEFKGIDMRLKKKEEKKVCSYSEREILV